ncbi:MAG TPA: DUF4350 domain-containing protein [Dermatophilaceae bacterium]|nr:DUF4350 domain-containing protein [Dermatophilaceae bacterium]
MTALTATGGTPARRRLPRAGRALPVLLVLLVLGSVAALTVLTSSQEPHRERLDPQNALPGGARAVAQVLGQRGVRVDIARSAADLAAREVGTATTVLVSLPDRLSDRTARHAADVAGRGSGLVLLAPEQPVLDAMGLPARAVRSVRQSATAGCSTALADPQDQLTRPRIAYLSERAADTCFRGDDGPYLVRLATGSGLPVTVVGASDFLSNDGITQADNAALALRLLGRTAHLVWYVPSLGDVQVGDRPGRESVVPPVAGPGLLVLASAALALVLWRGRRLGRLVTEPLPVVVRAVETTESRGRMYRRARDRERAAAVLRHATRARLAAYLGLPAGTPATAIAAAAASASNRPYDAVLCLLGDPPAGSAGMDDGQLVRLAGELEQLERAVRRQGLPA